MSEFAVQKEAEMYFKHYDDLNRFISYYYQIDLVRKYKPSTVLEIGVGNKLFSDYIKRLGVKVTTVDFDDKLHPDVVASVTSMPIADEAFDAVAVFEVLEHLTWEDDEKAVAELARVTKDLAFISIPYSAYNFEFVFKLPFLKRLTKHNFEDWFFRIPFFFKEHKFDGEHYWEIGWKGYPLKRVKALFEKHFVIEKTFRPVINSYHQFFVLRKKK